MAQAPKGSETRGSETKSAGTSTLPYRVLARKYRPIDFTTLVGQEAMVRTLRNAFATGRIAHAFMLTGVRGVGKTTTARIIARALNCVGPDGKGGPTVDPCGVCENCRAITEDRHVDVIEMDAASRTGIDDVRELIEGVRYRPVSARYKVYIIDEVHMLSEKAFNALLKTLEEPPPHVKFLFATTEIRKVPVTVLSRCQRFDLKRVPQETLIEHFSEHRRSREGRDLARGAGPARARRRRLGARRAVACSTRRSPMAAAWSMPRRCATCWAWPTAAAVLDLFEKTMKGDAPAVVAALGEMHDSGADPVVILQDLLELTHWVTRLKVAPEAARRLGRQRARAGSGDGRQAFHGVADAGLDAAAQGPAGDALRALGPARGRDGADPPVLRRRPALACRRHQGVAERRRRGGERQRGECRARAVAAVAAAVRRPARRRSPWHRPWRSRPKRRRRPCPIPRASPTSWRCSKRGARRAWSIT